MIFHSTGVYVHGNGVRALKALGLAEQMLARAGACRTSESWITPDDSWRRSNWQMWGGVGPCVGIARGELHRFSWRAAGVPIRLGTSVTGLRQHDDKVDVVFTNGSTGRYDLVVGAGGIHSWVRQLLVGDITHGILAESSLLLRGSRNLHERRRAGIRWVQHRKDKQGSRVKAATPRRIHALEICGKRLYRRYQPLLDEP